MIKKLFLNEKIILILILLNSVTIFVSGFEIAPNNRFILSLTDNLITGLFIAEIIVKFQEFGIKNYFKSNWNKFDFILVALSFPTLIAFIGNLEITSFSFLLVFRVMRVFKSFRFLKFIPGIEHLVKGIRRALKASIVVLIGFVIYIFIIGIFSFYLFKEISPEYFGNPLKSLYSIFKIFTVEGWYEIPEQLTRGLSATTSFFTYMYFIFVVTSGGIFGLSLVNSIFVDAMVSDNNDELENKIDLLDQKIDKLLTKKEEL
jgi:voltage-gated sodium channel|tara:strand:+ start:75 stop:854 length:780 start_codon:yes stop_codon:yes gene_type:complete